MPAVQAEIEKSLVILIPLLTLILVALGTNLLQDIRHRAKKRDISLAELRNDMLAIAEALGITLPSQQAATQAHLPKVRLDRPPKGGRRREDIQPASEADSATI